MEMPDGVLLRFELPAGAWAESVPPVPAGVTVTVAFSDDHAEGEHGEAVRLLGYDVIGVLPPRGPTDRDVAGQEPASGTGHTAEMLIRGVQLERHETWFRSLLSQCSRAFDLSAGPVLVVLRDRWEPHLLAQSAQIRPHGD